MGLWAWVAGLAPAQATVFGAAIGATFGFISLTGGALFNAKLNRDRDDRLGDLERLALLRSLATEITLIRNLISYQIREYQSPAAQGQTWRSSVSPKLFSLLYPANLSKLLGLPHDALTKVIIFHAAIDEYEYNLKTDGANFPDNAPIAARSFNFPVSATPQIIARASALRDSADSALIHLAAAVADFEKRLKKRPETSNLVSKLD
ncbi:hypothetical protein ELG88_09680 [Rhizobium leguminosarum]|uniref:hypothetical protein n=1 Tax=Rhizobium leguminosarum TaxID=384 RepID=UPI0010318BEC|nr:hypothetical protein [Rhizobium leguminosarum]TAY66533.1 hypothetical protein ELH82_10210 [Rhizobium leguminosarum]TBF35459.1 hypothetical protein ELG88_09680 [Rhizobium leguminosarum]